MGCLFFFIEWIIEDILYAWFELMQWIVPEKFLNKYVKLVMKILVWIFSGVVLSVFFIGIVALFDDEPEVNSFGRYMVFISLGISAVQIILGIVMRVIRNRKK